MRSLAIDEVKYISGGEEGCAVSNNYPPFNQYFADEGTNLNCLNGGLNKNELGVCIEGHGGGTPYECVGDTWVINLSNLPSS